MVFSAFTPFAGGNDLSTYRRKTEHPFDLDAGLDFTRPATGFSIFPFPVGLGYVNGFSPLQNAAEYAMMKGRTPFGSWAPGGVYPSTPDQLSFVFPELQGGLQKVKG